MATSGSVDFELNRDKVINLALFEVGAIVPEGSPTSAQTSNASFLLNALVKSWHVEGMPLWALKKGYILPVDGTNSMAINSHAVTTYAQTQVATAATSGATSIAVDSLTGVSDSDQIGIEIDDGTIHWTTVSSSSSATITIATALDGAAAVDNYIYVYTAAADRITRPERVYHAYTNDVNSGYDQEMEIITYQEYVSLTNKSQSESYPLQLYYDPQLGNNAMFHWWPRHQNGRKIMVIRYRRPFEDFDASTDTPDFPASWSLALIWGLAALLAPGYGIPFHERKEFWAEAEKLKNEQLLALQEEGSIFLEPERRDHGG